MPVDENVLQKVCELLGPLVPQGQQVNVETDLVADLGLDSLKVMKLLESVEDSCRRSGP